MKALIIVGPTASGKTNFAHHLATKYNGEIINADSMQIYKQIPIITTSPEHELTSEINYHLYNFIDISEQFSFIKYIELATVKIKEIINIGKLPILVGGTGLYVNSLLYGYNELPQADINIRNKVRNLFNTLGAEYFFKMLCQVDPLANKLKLNDKQRVIRAYEVFLQTGCSIFSFHNNNNILPLPEVNFTIFSLLPEREFLYQCCNERLKKIFPKAVKEIETIYQQKGDKISNKAIGISDIINYIEGKSSYEQTIETISMKTRRYAKRQITWFKNQLKNKIDLNFSNLEEYQQLYDIKRFINFNIFKSF